MLESEGLALGVVTAIAGQSRFNLVFEGHAGPRGDDPDAPAPRRRRRGRRVRARAPSGSPAREPGLVATVGELNVPRGAVNVIPGRADVTLDIRHQDDAVREARGRAAARRDRGDRRAPRRRASRGRRSPSSAPPAAPRRSCARVAEAVAATGVHSARAAQRRRPRRGDDGRA